MSNSYRLPFDRNCIVEKLQRRLGFQELRHLEREESMISNQYLMQSEHILDLQERLLELNKRNGRTHTTSIFPGSTSVLKKQ